MVDWSKKEVKLQGIALKKMWHTYGEGTIERLKRDMESLNKIGQCQSIIHQLDDVLPELWETLRETDKEQFLTKYGRKWEKFRSPVPKKTAHKLINFYDKGKLHLTGRKKDIIKENESISTELENDVNVNSSGLCYQCCRTKEKRVFT